MRLVTSPLAFGICSSLIHAIYMLPSSGTTLLLSVTMASSSVWPWASAVVTPGPIGHGQCSKTLGATGYDLSIRVHDMDVRPRSCRSKGACLCKYHKGFARPKGKHARSLLEQPVSAACMKRLLRFRVGCHRLPRHEGTFRKIPRLQRVCTLRTSGSLGHKKQSNLFECAEIQPLQDQWPHLLRDLRLCRNSCGRITCLVLPIVSMCFGEGVFPGGPSNGNQTSSIQPGEAGEMETDLI